jgi:hypothetical protein
MRRQAPGIFLRISEENEAAACVAEVGQVTYNKVALVDMDRPEHAAPYGVPAALAAVTDDSTVVRRLVPCISTDAVGFRRTT